ncbi:transcriptional activator of glycolytic enzymes-domain-containing protein [Phlyctochytrium arcticum]|nr:transcriptional activator of glycolytic enzymes-domain-containing protein [Phlyctochytrium arcticum]
MTNSLEVENEQLKAYMLAISRADAQRERDMNEFRASMALFNHQMAMMAQIFNQASMGFHAAALALNSSTPATAGPSFPKIPPASAQAPAAPSLSSPFAIPIETAQPPASPSTLSPPVLPTPTTTSDPSATTSSASASVATSTPPTSSHASTNPSTSTSGNRSSTVQSQDPLVPVFELKREHEHVIPVWQEYVQGVSGQISVQAMEEQWGPRWRRCPRKKSLYCRRNFIYRAVKEVMKQKGCSGEEAAEMLEEKKKSMATGQFGTGMGLKRFEAWCKVNLLAHSGPL